METQTLSPQKKLLSIPDLFKKSFELYKPRFWAMFLLSLIECAIFLIIAAVFGGAAFAPFLFSKEAPAFSLWSLLVALIGLLIFIIISLWIQLALVYTIKEQGTDINIKKLLTGVRGKMNSYYWVVFLRAIITVAGFVLLVVPGIIFSVWFIFAPYIFIFEDVKGMQALSRSRELVKGYWWPVFGRMALLALIGILVSSISKIGSLLNFLFTMPFGIMYLYAVYEDLKRVK